MKNRSRLRLEQLEDRCTPSTLGQPWPNPGQLTLSFAPDGTLINGTPSTLFQTLNRIAPTSTWEQAILKGFQAWVPYTNINLSPVADGGQPFGTDGAVQGDSRFGDIRIGMAALPANLVATTSPFSWTGSTWSGDMILNSNYSFGVGGQGQYDLFSVAMHEAGHSLGIPDNTTDVNSVMFANYTGPRSGLDSLDVATIQALYGARSPDAFNAAHANNTLATASAIGNTSSQLGFNADLTTPGQVEFYKVQMPLLGLGLGSVTFQINAAQMSMLVPTLSVYNASGRLIATQTAASPFSNTVSITIPNPALLGTYYFEVSHPTSDAFAVGDYSAVVTYKSLLGEILTGIVPSLIQGVVNTVNHVNTSLASSTMLTAAFAGSSDQRFSYLYQANIVDGGDADYYKFTVPAISSSTGAYALDAMAWQSAPGGLAPVLHFFDGSGNPIAADVMADSNSVYSIQLLGVTAGEGLYVEVAGQTTAGAGSTGFYVLGIKFNQAPETIAPLLGGNTLATATSTDSATLSMNQNGVFYFELAAANGSPAASGSVTMTAYDSDGDAAMTLTTAIGAAPRTTAAYLPVGTYTIVYSISASAGTSLPTTYWLSGEILSDPIGPYYASANSGSTGSSGSSSTSSSSTTGTTGTTGTNGTSTVSATKTFASSGASVSISTPSGTINVPIPPPGGTWSQSFTTSAGVTTVTLTTASNGNTTLTVTTPSKNTITDTVTTSGSASTETLTTSDGIRVTIITPVTTPAPTYSGSSPSTSQQYYY
jgi:Matrixin